VAGIRIQTTQNIELEYELAGVGDRLVAYLIDLLLYGAYLFLVILLETETDFLSSLGGWAIVFYALPILTYQLLCEVLMNGQSIGKKVRRLRVVSLDGRQPTLGQYAIRWVFRIVDDMIGSGVVAILCISSTERAQRVGDLLAGTTVVRSEPLAKFHETIHARTDEHYVPIHANAMLLNDQDISLLKEVLNLVAKEPGRHARILRKAAEKTRQVIGTGPKDEGDLVGYLETVVRDYNHLTGGEEV
jgi:uncharacterized RDD family membrane protein YckC